MISAAASLTDSGSIVNVFRGLTVERARTSDHVGTVSIDTSGVVGVDPVYLTNVTVKERRDLDLDGARHDIFAIGDYSAERTRLAFGYTITGSDPFLQLTITLANHGNRHRPTFTPTVRFTDGD